MQDIFSVQDVPIRDRVRRVLRGIRAPKESGDYKYAMMALQRTFGPSFVAMLVSGFIVFALVSLIVSRQMSADRQFEVIMYEPDVVKVDEMKDIEQEIQEEIPEIQEDTMDVGTADVVTPSEVGIGTPIDDTPVVVMAPVMTKSPLIMRNLYGNRTPGGRSAALKAFRAPRETEDAVLRGLRWLKRMQKEDGTWGGNTAASTGFALLAFLAHGETPSSPEFGATVQKAIQAMVAMQGATDGSRYNRNGYAHGIASYAMCEAFAMTKIMPVKESAEKALQIIIDGQQVLGGYNYDYTKVPRWDLSVAGWQFQALKAGKMAGLSNPGIDQALQKATTWLKNVAFDPSAGGFGYSGENAGHGGSKWTMNGVGCLCLQLFGYSRDPEVRAGLAKLDTMGFDWKGGKDDDAKEGAHGVNSVYGWYYVTQAKFQDGGARWDSWNKAFSKQLCDAQKMNAEFKDGHWEGGDYCKNVSAAPAHVYTTAMSCLMLEVYYRYLPTYKKVEDAGPPAATSDDDVKIQVSG